MLDKIFQVFVTSVCVFIVGGAVVWLIIELYLMVRELFDRPDPPIYIPPISRPPQPSTGPQPDLTVRAYQQPASVDDGFATSMALGAALNDGVTGGLLGGNLVGGVVGDLLVDNRLDFGSHQSGSNSSPIDTTPSTPSYDSGSSSSSDSFSGGTDFGGGDF